MATLNELGRNSASITYGPFTTGQDYWPTFALFDQWIRNDTMQGTVTASSTTITGVGTIFLTQLRAGDVIMIASQVRTIATVTSDTVATVTSAFSPAITLASAMEQINNTFGGGSGALAGTASISVRNSVNGTVSVTAGSAVITGVNTYFLSDCTNSVTTAGLAGTVAVDTSGLITGTGTSFTTGAPTANSLYPGDSVIIGTAYFVIATVTNDTSATVVTPPAVAISAGASIAKATNGASGRTIIIQGRVRQITSITSNTSMIVNAAMDFTDSGIKVRTFPRGTISVAAGSTAVTGSGTAFAWDCVSGDQIWIGDELRTFSFTANATTVATLSDYTGFAGTAIGQLRQAVTGIPFYRDDTYITGSGSNYLNELRVNDELIIDGTRVVVSAIISSTSFRVTVPFTHTMTTSTIWKLKKVHGYVLEGSREGAATGNKLSISTTSATAAGSVQNYGQTVINVASTSSFTAFGIVKVIGGGGPPVALAGQVTVSGTAVSGTNTLFTTQLHIGAEIVVAGQYAVVSAITNDTACTIVQSMTVASLTPIYRPQPLYTFIASITTNQITIGTPLRNTLYSVGANPPLIYTHAAATDFIEYIYSAPNYAADNITGGGTATLSNTSLDRKYFGLRYYPQQQGGGSGTAFATAGSAYNITVYERWAGSYAGSNGVGINQSDLSGGTHSTQSTAPDYYGPDLTSMTQTSGGFLYLFAHPRYFAVQGKTFSNAQSRWLGCIEFERAQPEDTGTGLGSSSGITFNIGAPIITAGAPTSNTTIAINISPWPCFAYFNGDRFPIGGSQLPTLPVAVQHGVHGMLFAVPRVRCSTGDLTGRNAHIYSSCTITTGGWGHMIEFIGSGAYISAGSPSLGTLGAQAVAGAVPQLHMGQIVPVYTNVYNSKRFMFSPVVVLGPKYDPDIRGRIYGLKVIPSALGTLMDTVSVTIDSNFFYNAAGTATDHWVLTSAVNTVQMSLAGTVVAQQWRSLESNTTPGANQNNTSYANSFRFALPA